jgi:hypothetical protein
METLVRNEFILQEIKKRGFTDLEIIFKRIKGDITIEKIYKEIFNSLKVNFYTSTDDKYYIELKRYVEGVTNNSCKERQILTNKAASDEKKIKRLEEINIKSKYECNEITPKKRIIEISGLYTVNDSIKRFGKDIPLTFFQWHQLCEIIVINLPVVIQEGVKNYFKEEFDKIHEKDMDKQRQLDDQKHQIENLQLQLLEIKNLLSKG